jgi:hypothetical protein
MTLAGDVAGRNSREVTMTLQRLALAMVFACAMVPLACEERQEPANTDNQAWDVQPPPLVETEMIVGDLLSVDADAKTFTVEADDAQEHDFRFSDATIVSGESGMQALTGREGARVTVYYREGADGVKEAAKIELSH